MEKISRIQCSETGASAEAQYLRACFCSTNSRGKIGTARSLCCAQNVLNLCAIFLIGRCLTSCLRWMNSAKQVTPETMLKLHSLFMTTRRQRYTKVLSCTERQTTPINYKQSSRLSKHAMKRASFVRITQSLRTF